MALREREKFVKPEFVQPGARYHYSLFEENDRVEVPEHNMTDLDVLTDFESDNMTNSVVLVTQKELEARRERHKASTGHIEEVVENNCKGIENLFGFADTVGHWVFGGDSEIHVGLSSSFEMRDWIESRHIGFQEKQLPADGASIEDMCSVVATMYKMKQTEEGSLLETKSDNFDMRCRTEKEALVCDRVEPYVYKLEEGESTHEGVSDMQRQIVMSLTQVERDLDELSSLTSSMVDGSRRKREWVLRITESPVGSDTRFGEWTAQFVLDKVPVSDESDLIEF